ncbi:MAG: response regulator transcription factor, partial [Thiohalocapsa sp.]
MRVLIIEDDAQLAAYLTKAFAEVGAVVEHAADGRDGLLRAAGNDYDALVVDRMLPSLDGLGIVRTLRASGDKTPVLILSALGEVDDRVDGLRAGGDDYLVKPFAFSELHARVEALLRRAVPGDQPETRLALGDLEMDLLTRQVSRAGQAIALQPREFRLLEYLMRHAGQVVTRTMLLEHVWDYNFDPQTNVIDVHISRLRGKIDKEFDQPLLHT